MNFRKQLPLLVTVGLLNIGSAFAGPLNITNIVGDWVNPNPVAGIAITNVAAQGQDQVRWGTPEGSGQSGYNFTPAGNIVPVVLGTPFLLGTFQHVNFPITGTFLSSIDYSISFTTNGAPTSLGDTFTFTHNETPNFGPCAAGPEGPSVSVCDDFVTISQLGLNNNIVVGTDTYAFTLLGFSKTGGTTTTTGFQSAENGTNSAGLYAVVTLANPGPVTTPEPSVLMFLVAGLGGVALTGRRFRK